jgi:hypothetical protein
MEPHVKRPLCAEEFHFSFQYAGHPAGSERWVSQFDRNQFLIRREVQFQGSLGPSKRVQTTRLEPETRLPLVFSENDNGRVFETTFDRKKGLLTLRQQRDEASQALTQDYHDPLSVVQYLRDLPEDVQTARVPMVGGTVLVTRLEDETLNTPWGELLARAYYLRPGMGFVYIEAAAPHRPLKFVQVLGRFSLEATISRGGEARADGQREHSKRPRSRRGRQNQANAEPRETGAPRQDGPRSQRAEKQGGGRPPRDGQSFREKRSEPNQNRDGQPRPPREARGQSQPRAPQNTGQPSGTGPSGAQDGAKRSRRRRRFKKREGGGGETQG